MQFAAVKAWPYVVPDAAESAIVKHVVEAETRAAAHVVAVALTLTDGAPFLAATVHVVPDARDAVAAVT